MLEQRIFSPRADLAIAPPPVCGDQHRFSPMQVEQLLAAAIELGAVAQGVVEVPPCPPVFAASLLEGPAAAMRIALASMGYAFSQGRTQ
jgi:hypothetical protein